MNFQKSDPKQVVLLKIPVSWAQRCHLTGPIQVEPSGFKIWPQKVKFFDFLAIFWAFLSKNRKKTPFPRKSPLKTYKKEPFLTIFGQKSIFSRGGAGVSEKTRFFKGVFPRIFFDFFRKSSKKGPKIRPPGKNHPPNGQKLKKWPQNLKKWPPKPLMAWPGGISSVITQRRQQIWS